MRQPGLRRLRAGSSGAPAGVAFSLADDTGSTEWLTPVADGVVWTVDSQANLDGFDAANGRVLLRRPLSVDAGAPIVNNTSSGVAIAEHKLFVAAGGAGYASTTGYVVAYRAAYPAPCKTHQIPPAAAGLGDISMVSMLMSPRWTRGRVLW